MLTDFLRQPQAASLSRVSTFLEKEVSYIHFHYKLFFKKIFLCGCYGGISGLLEHCLLGCASFSFPALWRLGDLKLKQTLNSSCLSGLHVTLFDGRCLSMFSSCSAFTHETRHRLGSSIILCSVQLPVVQILSNLSRIQPFLSSLLLCPYAKHLSVIPLFALCL